MFPQYLPSRLALDVRARRRSRLAARRATRVLTVSESSKRDILRFVDVAAGQDRRHLQRLRRAVRHRAARRGRRARARALPAARRVRAVRRQRQAAQESRAPDRGVRPRAQARARPPEAGAHRRRDFEIRRAPARRAFASAPQVRALPRLPAGGDAGGDVPACRRVRLPVALRRLRASAARSDGQRHAGGHVERVVAARGRRRRRGAGRSRIDPEAIADGIERVLSDEAPAARPARARDSRARGSSRGKRRCARVREIYGEVAEAPASLARAS